MKLTDFRSLSWRTVARVGHWLVKQATVARVGHWLVKQAGVHLYSDVIHADDPDDPIADILYRAVGNLTGKLRVADVYLICGLDAGRVSQDQIDRVDRAIRALGWERRRRRHDGTLEYVYIRGNDAEREVELLVEYDQHIERATN